MMVWSSVRVLGDGVDSYVHVDACKELGRDGAHVL